MTKKIRGDGTRHVPVVMMLMVLALVVGSVARGASGSALRIDPGAWDLQRIWKSAHERGGARYHFYRGKFRLVNAAGKQITNLRAQIRILDPQGRLIRSTAPIACGDLQPGRAATRRFSLDRAVQFSELVLKAKFSLDGKERCLEFSSTDGSCPRPVVIDPTGAVNELRVLSHEIEQKVLAGRAGRATLVIRVRNLSALPASRPMAKLTLFGVKSRKKRRRRRSSRRRKASTAGSRVARKGNVWEILLDEGEVPPGETKVYRKKLNRIPDYDGYNVSVSATWPDKVIEEPGKVETFKDTRGEGDTLVFGELKSSRGADGSVGLAIAVTNRGESIAAGKLCITIILKDAGNKEVARITQVCPQAIERGKTVEVKVPPRKLPAFTGYEVGFEF